MSSGPSFNSNIEKRLLERERSGTLRSLKLLGSGIDLCSNDYLGFAQRVAHKVPKSTSGSTGSRLISGNSRYAEEIEGRIAQFHRAEAALIFNSGYDANLGLLSALGRRHDSFILDELSHASIHDGARLSFAQRYTFRHNDCDDLRKKLSHVKGTPIVVVESIYSMDGDRAPLSEIAALCREHGASLIVDEAHAAGVLGAHGIGLAADTAFDDVLLARVITFGKAFGAHGAVVLGSEKLRSYLINFARSFIYSTALPESALRSIHRSYQWCVDAEAERASLHKIKRYFEETFKQLPTTIFSPSGSHIQRIMIADVVAVRKIAEDLRRQGINLLPILSPTVPQGSERLRVSLHAFNTPAEIDRCAEILIPQLLLIGQKL